MDPEEMDEEFCGGIDHEPDVDELQENGDFAHDGESDNYIIEDQHLDGMYEE
jgi:hypothetical protein